MNTTTAQTAKFDRIISLEDEVKIMEAQAAFTGAGTPVFVQDRQDRSRRSAKQKLFTEIADLTMDEAKAFGDYRVTLFGERRGLCL